MPIYIKFDGIDGEATDSKHKGEIEVLSWSWGTSNAGSSHGGGGGAGKVSVQDLSIMKRLDKATPKLMLACASGKHIKEATLSLRTAGEAGRVFLKVTMRDVLVTSVMDAGSQGESNPYQALSLQPSIVLLEHYRIMGDGSVKTFKTGYDVKQNKKV